MNFHTAHTIHHILQFITCLASSEYQGPKKLQRNFIRKGKAKRECAPASFLLKIATYNYNNTLLCDYGTYTVSLGLLHQQNGTSLYSVFLFVFSGDFT